MTRARMLQPGRGRRLDRGSRQGAPDGAFDPGGSGRLYWTSTARSALRPILLHHRSTGRLPDKNGEVLVPRWACTSLYNTLQKVCFPTIQVTPALRGVLIYHQYGFPQRMTELAQRCRDLGLFMIENCVNCAFDGPASGGMGQHGTASIFSLPKMWRTTLGGALLSRDEALSAFCDGYFAQDEGWIGRASRAARVLNERLPGPRTALAQEMVYGMSDYGRRASAVDLAHLQEDYSTDGLGLRKSRYRRLLTEFSDTPFFKGLEEDVVPFAAPLFGPQDFLARLSHRLTGEGWESGIFRFDAARNIFAPRFEPCVPIPVHQAMTESDHTSLIETIRSEWRDYDGK